MKYYIKKSLAWTKIKNLRKNDKDKIKIIICYVDIMIVIIKILNLKYENLQKNDQKQK